VCSSDLERIWEENGSTEFLERTPSVDTQLVRRFSKESKSEERDILWRLRLRRLNETNRRIEPQIFGLRFVEDAPAMV
jgi:hypothetical protein